MQIDRIEELRMTAAEEAEVSSLLGRCFDTDFGGRSYYIQRHHVRFVARQDGKMIGHLGMTFRAIRIDGDLVNIVGIGDVATDPNYRSRGVAGKVLDACLVEAKQSVAEFAMLFGVAGVYAGAGFETVKNPMRFVQMTGAVTADVIDANAQELMVLPLRGKPWDSDANLDLLGYLF